MYVHTYHVCSVCPPSCIHHHMYTYVHTYILLNVTRDSRVIRSRLPHPPVCQTVESSPHE